MTPRYETIRYALVDAFAHALSEGMQFKPCAEVDEVVVKRNSYKLVAIQLGSACCECGVPVYQVWSPILQQDVNHHVDRDGKPLPLLELDHDAAPDDESTGVVFHLEPSPGEISAPGGDTRKPIMLTSDEQTWEMLGLEGLCAALDEVVSPTDMTELSRYLAFGKEFL